ncbi:MAG: TetR/AcrR family transcriptional regulator [Myxococcota bacterium]
MAAEAPRRTRQDVLRDFRTEQILEAARRVIGKTGYAEASMERIAEEAGVARSTVYVYFQSKEEILHRCFALGRRQLAERIDEALAGAAGSEARLVAVVASVLAHVDGSRPFFWAVNSLTEAGAAAELAGLAQDVRDRLAALLREGVEAGDLPVHDVRRSNAVLGVMIQGAVALRMREERPGAAPAAAAELIRFFLRGVAAAADPVAEPA